MKNIEDFKYRIKKSNPRDVETMFKIYNFFMENKNTYYSYVQVSEILNLKISEVRTLVNHLLKNDLISKKFKLKTPPFLKQCDKKGICVFHHGNKIGEVCLEEKEKLLNLCKLYSIDDLEFKIQVNEFKESKILSSIFFENFKSINQKLEEHNFKRLNSLEFNRISQKFIIKS